jgi:hypothetical protein
MQFNACAIDRAYFPICGAVRSLVEQVEENTYPNADRHLGASISSLVPSVSCRRCSPNALFAKLEMLTAEQP